MAHGSPTNGASPTWARPRTELTNAPGPEHDCRSGRLRLVTGPPDPTAIRPARRPTGRCPTCLRTRRPAAKRATRWTGERHVMLDSEMDVLD